MAKSIVTLASSKITLLGANKCLRNEVYLDNMALEAILNAPSCDSATGLRKNILILPEEHKSRTPLASLIKCENCIFRKIAILIISGKVKVSEFPLSDFLKNKFSSTNTVLGHHGSDWHKRMMDRVANSFKYKQGVVIEPVMNYGRADLGYFFDIGKSTYVEVGTVSLFKIWYNLTTMRNCVCILIPNDDVIIKFET